MGAKTRLRSVTIGVIIIDAMHQFSPKFRVTFAVLSALFCVLAFPTLARCQPNNVAESVSVIAVTPTESGLSVDVRAQLVSAAKVIAELASKTNTDIIIYADAEIASVDFKKASPSEALKKVVDVAGLWMQLEGKTYIIDKKTAAQKSKNNGIEMVFRDIGIRELLETLATQFDLKIEIAPNVSGQLIAIRLDDETAVSAVEKIARGAKLSLEITKDGVYRVGFDEPKAD